MKAYWQRCIVLAVFFASLSPLYAEVASVRLTLSDKNGQAAAGTKRSPNAIPTAYAVETDAAPVLDGKLSDPCWSKADPLTLDFSLDGEESAPVATEVRLLRDAKMLYVGYRCTEPFADKLKAEAAAHDADLWEDDCAEIFIGTEEAYYHLIVNSKGTTYDAKAKERSWESGFRAAAAVGKGEWTMEAAIPLEKVASGAAIPQQFIANFNRTRHAGGKLEEMAWSSTLCGDSHMPGRFGALKFEPPPASAAPVQTAQAAETTSGGVKLSSAGGEGVVRFDLAFLPKGAKVLRADLFVSRTAELTGKDDNVMVNIEIIPLFQEFKEGDAPKAEKEPLAIRGPWFDCLDATEAVQAWAAGKPNGGFFVKALPLWKSKATALEILYEGAPKNVPPPAGGLKVLHRAGQTFITWKEIKDLAGKDEMTWGALRRVMDSMNKEPQIRYCVYKSRKPITSKTLDEAEKIATVKPLSSWNINGRNIERPIDEFMQQYSLNHGQWSPFWDGDVDGKFGLECRMDRFVIEVGGKPLSRDAGLYVHTPVEQGKAYYAVVTAADGVQNTRDFSDANSLKDPVEETPAEPQPVLQGELPARPFNNYDETRFHCVQWTAPPMGNLPSQYYNWSAAVPLALEKGVPLELSLHREGLAYYRTQYRIEQTSIVLLPYDFPVNTGWYGYHEALSTLKSFKQGAIHNYTEKRLLAFIEWACRKWPVDRNRILVTSLRGYSNSGAMHLAFRHPEVFNMVLIGYGFADYKAALQIDDQTERKGSVPDMERLFGKIAWDLKTAEGRSVWDENNITQKVRDLPSAADLPFLTMSGTYFKKSLRDFFAVLTEKGRPFMTDFNTWGGRFIPVATTGTWTGMAREDVRKNLSLPAFKSTDAAKLDKEDAKQYEVALNNGFRWDTKGIVDEAARYEIALRFQGRGAGTADVTLRRLQQFKVETGKSYAWEFNLAVPDKKAGGPQKGEVTVGENGLLTIPGLKITDASGRLVVTAK